MSDDQIDKIQSALEAKILERLEKNNNGGYIEKHILLLKLTKAMECVPDFNCGFVADFNSPQQQWLSMVYKRCFTSIRSCSMRIMKISAARFR